MQAPPHSIAPDVTTWNTLMKAYYHQSIKVKNGGDSCFAAFERMLAARVAPNSVSLATVFSTLVYGLRGNRAAGAAKIIELSKKWVNAHTLTHSVAGGVLRALAEAGTAADVDTFWAFCSAQLGRTRQGWPGSSFKILSDLSQKFSGKGQWPRIAALLASSAARPPPHITLDNKLHRRQTCSSRPAHSHFETHTPCYFVHLEARASQCMMLPSPPACTPSATACCPHMVSNNNCLLLRLVVAVLLLQRFTSISQCLRHEIKALKCSIHNSVACALLSDTVSWTRGPWLMSGSRLHTQTHKAHCSSNVALSQSSCNYTPQLSLS